MGDYTLITGASGGIGLELARQAVLAGRNLLLVARSEGKLKQLQKELSSKNRKVEIMPLDLAKADSPAKIRKFCSDKKIFVQELINNAGVGDYGKFAELDLKRQRQMIDLNIRCLTELTRLYLPAMLAEKRGRIMNVASVAGFLPGPNMSVYYASKHYVRAFSEGLSQELRGSGVTLTCLCPGPTKSDFSDTSRSASTRMFQSKNLPSSAEVAAFGWRAMQAGKSVAIHGLQNKFLVFITRFIPRRLLAKAVEQAQGWLETFFEVLLRNPGNQIVRNRLTELKLQRTAAVLEGRDRFLKFRVINRNWINAHMFGVAGKINNVFAIDFKARNLITYGFLRFR